LIEIMNRRKFLTSAAAAPALAAAQSSDNFTLLFDGRTLAGWSIRQGPESAFYVRDGAIVVHQSAGFPTWLRSAKEYENFDFRGEFFVEGWIRFRHLFPRPGTWQKHLGRDADENLPPAGREAHAEFDGLDLPADCAAESKREE